MSVLFEYKVVPAPDRGKRAKGAKTGAARFALALESLMNELAAEGWEYQRTDTLPCEERVGLTGKTTVYQNMLVFRRAKAGEVSNPEVTALLAAPVREAAPMFAAAPPATAPEAAVAKEDAPVAPKRNKSAAAAAAAAALRAYQNATPAPIPRGLAAE